MLARQATHGTGLSAPAVPRGRLEDRGWARLSANSNQENRTVKRTAILAAGVVALGAVIYVGKLWAQTHPTAAGGPAPATAAGPARTRIALLNISHVVRNYNKYKTYQEELKRAVAPFTQRDAAAKKEAEDLTKEAQNAKTTPERREAIEKRMRELQFQMQNLKEEFNKKVGKMQEKQLVTLFADVRTVAERYAEGHNFDMVLQYNDAVEQNEYWSGPNIVRKMQAGALMPLYYRGGMEISQDIINTLNASYRTPAAGAGAAATPTR
jgi:Skp family chaperone for outer membrane proteins